MFIGTGKGVYSFDRNTLTWGRITTRNGLPDNRIRILGLDDGILWVATDSGLASADVRLGDWQTYELPGLVQGLDLDADYVWVGGDSGFWRFDKFAESWERLSGIRVNHLVLDRGELWLATDSGVMQYNTEFERLEPMYAEPGWRPGRIVPTPARLWVLGESEGGRLRFAWFERQSRVWTASDGFGIDGYATIGDSLFAVAAGTLSVCLPGADEWRRVRETEDVAAVNGLAVNSEKLVLATGQGLLVHEWERGSRQWYNRQGGMLEDSVLAVYEDRGQMYAAGAKGIQRLDKSSGIWQLEQFTEPGMRAAARFYLDDAGAHARLIPETDLRLAGRAYYSESRAFSPGAETRTSYDNLNLNLAALHESGRTLAFYYDNTDKEQVMYGLGYRGLDNDVLHRANGGFLESDYQDFDLIPGLELFGGNARFRRGSHSMNLQAGKLQSGVHADFFSGRTSEKEVSRQDVQYAQRQFYCVLGTARPLRRGVDTVFVDDRIPGNNGPGTLVDTVIGGVRGDFDLLINSLDYWVDYAQGIIRFREQRKASDVIVLDTEEETVVIQSDSAQGRELVNVYSFAPEVLPGSFELLIVDTLGLEHPLSEFGLDADGDGRVDDRFLNHDLGFIQFPESRPFPARVYETGTSVYTMQARFRSQSLFFALNQAPLVKNSERVTVDGEVVKRGVDYVVDYSLGSLVFVNEDLVSDFSEIEVLYSSVERERTDRLASCQPVLGLAQGVQVAPGFSRVAEENLFHASARIDKDWHEKRALMFVPQVAVSDDAGWAQHHTAAASYGILGLSGEYRGFSPGFEDFGAGERKYGKLEHSGSLGAVVEPVEHVRLDGQFRKEWQQDSVSARSAARYLFGRMSYLNPKLPNGYVLLGQDRLPDYDKAKLRIGAGHDFEALGSKLDLGAVVRSESQEVDTVAGRLLEYAVDAGFRLPVPVHGKVRFRTNRLSARDAVDKTENETRARLSFDWVPGCYYVGNYELGVSDFALPSSRDLVLDHFFYNTLHVAPGRWWQELSIANFSFGLGSTFEEYGRDVESGFRRPLLVLAPIEDVTVSSLNRTRSWFGTVQLVPRSELTFWYRHGESRSGAGYYGLPVESPGREDEVKVEYEPARYGKFTLNWDRRFASGRHQQTTNGLFLEWNMPWTDVLRTKFTNSLRHELSDFSVVRQTGSEIRSTLEALFRFAGRSFALARFGAGREVSEAGVVTYELVPGTGTSLALLGFLYVQVDYQSTFALSGTASHQFSGKVTAQF